MTKMDDLRALRTLARLRAERSASMLAKAQAVVDELRRRDANLREPVSRDNTALEDMVFHHRHEAWRAEQLRRIGSALAKAEAQAQPFREQFAKDTARSQVVDKLIERGGRRR